MHLDETSQFEIHLLTSVSYCETKLRYLMRRRMDSIEIFWSTVCASQVVNNVCVTSKHYEQAAGQ